MDPGVWVAIVGLALGQLGTVGAMVYRRGRAEARVDAALATYAEDLRRGRTRFERLEAQLAAMVRGVQAQQVELARITERLDALLREQAKE